MGRKNELKPMWVSPDESARVADHMQAIRDRHAAALVTQAAAEAAAREELLAASTEAQEAPPVVTPSRYPTTDFAEGYDVGRRVLLTRAKQRRLSETLGITMIKAISGIRDSRAELHTQLYVPIYPWRTMRHTLRELPLSLDGAEALVEDVLGGEPDEVLTVVVKSPGFRERPAPNASPLLACLIRSHDTIGEQGTHAYGLEHGGWSLDSMARTDQRFTLAGITIPGAADGDESAKKTGRSISACVDNFFGSGTHLDLGPLEPIKLEAPIVVWPHAS